MKFEKINYFIAGRFPNGNKYGITTKTEESGYTAAGLEGIAIKKRGGFWYVDHIKTGFGVVTVGSKTRDAAAAEYLNHYKEQLERLDPDTIKKAAQQLEELPLESEVATWESVNYCTTKNHRFDKVTAAAKRAGLLVKKANDNSYIDGGNINIIGAPAALEAIKEMIKAWEKHDTDAAEAAENAAELLPVVTSAAPDPEQAEQEQTDPEQTDPEQAAPLYGTGGSEKHFIGTTITGSGWRIVFDDKTRVVFDEVPPRRIRDAVKAAGFHWSPSEKSWNKKLSWKAYRAALRLADVLNELTEKAA